MSASIIPTMVVEDIELRVRPSSRLDIHPMSCDHLWEAHLWETGRAYCPCCGAFGHWVNDPRDNEETP